LIQAFTYEIAEFSFNGRELNRNYIKYLVIECLYESRTMAVMYVSLHIPSELYQDILNAEKTENGFINLSMRSKNVYSGTSLANDYISGRYVYVLPTSNPDYSVNLSSEEDKSYKSLTLGLLDKDYLDKMKTSLCGTYYNIDIQDLLRLALKDMKNVIVQPPTVEDLKKFAKIVIPPMNNMNKLVAYLYNLKPFYNTAYTFFADFTNLYLTAHDAETTAAIGAINTIIFHVNSVTNDAAYYEGVVPSGGIEGDVYHIYLNPADISVSPNKSLDFISNQIMDVQESGMVSEPIQLDYGLLGSEESEYSKIAIRRGDNASVVANVYNSNTVTVEFKKSHINGALISPDKAIMVSFELSDDKDDFNNKYSGNYYLIYKREIVANNAGTFAVSCAVGLKKIGNLVSVSDTSSTDTMGTGTSSLGYSSGEGSAGSRAYKQGSSNSRVQTSSKISQTTQAKMSRVSGTKIGIATSSPFRANTSNPYNLKVSKYTGPVDIDTNSSGAINLFEPHINEKKI